MASIKKRDNGRWRARYRDDAGREHARHFDRKVDAQRWLDQVTAAVVRGEYVDPRAGQVTLASYAASWEAIQVSSESTRRIVDNALRLHIVPTLGAHKVGAVRRSHVQAFIKHLESKDLTLTWIRGGGLSRLCWLDRVCASGSCSASACSTSTTSVAASASNARGCRAASLRL